MAALKTVSNWRRFARGERGAELIEFALVLPLLLLVVLGIVDFGFMFQRLEVVTNAAREGARIAVLAGYSTIDVKDRVNDYLLEGGVPIVVGTNPVINVNQVPLAVPGGGTITAEQVQVTYTHTYMFLSGLASWFGGSFSTVPLNAVSTMRVEGGGS
jgi:Flp pilus assembly protein TadG